MKNFRVYILVCLTLLSWVLIKGESHIDYFNNRPMIVANGEPMLVLGGELGNSTASSPEDIKSNILLAKQGGLNTILVPVYWDMIEPSQGNFDFSLIDSILETVRENDLKIGILWFGAWKNSMSCYSPEWIKVNASEYTRARTSSGKPLEILSVFDPNVLHADLTAFKALLNHIKQNDEDGNVILIQVENEIGMLEEARDYAQLAKKEYSKGVPPQLMSYLNKNKDRLHPSLQNKWRTNGYKMTGSWKEVFGDDILTDEYFMAWNYAKYVEQLASRGKQIYPAVYYVNAALNSRDRKPGEYPSAGPLAHLKDIWHAGAPSIDFISPDIYDSGFEDWVAQYALDDNLLFVPEVKREIDNIAQAFYIIGHHDALGISPFSIENGDSSYFAGLSSAYGVLNDLTPILMRQDENRLKEGVILSSEIPSIILNDEDTKITLSHFFTLPWDPRASDKNNWNASGAIILNVTPNEYILAGSGVVAKFEHSSEDSSVLNLGEDGFVLKGDSKNNATTLSHSKRIGLTKVQEIKVNPDGTYTNVRTLNGDETHQGRHVRISPDEHKILHIKTYIYE